MEKYNKAVIEVCEFKNEDIIRTSGDDPINECTCNIGIAFGAPIGGGGGGR